MWVWVWHTSVDEHYCECGWLYQYQYCEVEVQGGLVMCSPTTTILELTHHRSCIAFVYLTHIPQPLPPHLFHHRHHVQPSQDPRTGAILSVL